MVLLKHHGLMPAKQPAQTALPQVCRPKLLKPSMRLTMHDSTPGCCLDPWQQHELYTMACMISCVDDQLATYCLTMAW